ncbi:glycosyl transferase [Leptolyngbya valderiana BDU 20041]|nr:glycosyl transferase [Leptolyngbya valderiana BDU 20041]PPT10809.1 Glycosyl transferase family 2 [Geitlerinema sp. FC II]
MPANFWFDRNSSRAGEPLQAILFDREDEEREGGESEVPVSYRGYAGRRRKAAIVLTLVWGGTIVLHSVSWGAWFVMGLTGLLGLHAMRLIFATPRAEVSWGRDLDRSQLPYVSFLVAAKDEEAVVESLVEMLCDLDYPEDCYEVWAIDDNSSDRTPELLDRLAQRYDRLRVLHRDGTARGGKSGALNNALQFAKGDIVAVFDADAKVNADFLWRVLPLFERDRVGAVQVRKAIDNANDNFWTQGQTTEMILDAYVQEKRVALGGIGELRGNGQLIRRSALERCGHFNEETITDDLDLTLRLHLDRWDIECVTLPTVSEEAVTQPLALWHQRSRWAEGGYQRYLDYWRLLFGSRLSFAKRLDLFVFVLMQYILPTAALPDLVMAIVRTRLPIFSPLTTLTVGLSMLWMFLGLRRCDRLHGKQQPLWVILLQSLRGTLYMMHWLVVMASTTARLAVRPKRLKWVKTLHQGHR